MKEKKQEKKEVYSAEDLILRGTYISTMNMFWDHLYKMFPELTNNNIIMKETYRKSTEEEKNNFIDRILNNKKNLLFKINSFKEEGFVKAKPEMLCDKVLSSIFKNELFGIVEIKNRDNNIHYAELISTFGEDVLKHIGIDKIRMPVVDLEWIYFNYDI